MTVRGGVGDILAVCCPLDFVAAVLHQTNEMFPAPGLRHALVYGDLQVHLPAPSLGIGTVLPVGHGAFPLLLLLGFYNRKTVLHTQLVRCFPKLFQRISIAVVLETGVAAYRVDAGDQRSALVVHLGILTAVVDDRIETAHGLGAFAFHEMDDGHYFHRLALRMSESKELTCAYASESSLRYTVFTLPILARVVSWLRFRPMAFC